MQCWFYGKIYFCPSLKMCERHIIRKSANNNSGNEVSVTRNKQLYESIYIKTFYCVILLQPNFTSVTNKTICICLYWWIGTSHCSDLWLWPKYSLKNIDILRIHMSISQESCLYSFIDTRPTYLTQVTRCAPGAFWIAMSL